METGRKIHSIRQARGFTLRSLGIAIGLNEKTADIRMAQYEAGDRTPKEEMLIGLSAVLGTEPEYLLTYHTESEEHIIGFIIDAITQGVITPYTVNDENGRKHTAFMSDSDTITQFMDYAAVICKIRKADLFSLLTDFDE